MNLLCFVHCSFTWLIDEFLDFDLGTVLFLQKAGSFHGNKQISVHHLRHQGVDRKSCWHWISSLAHTRHKKQLCYYFNVIHEKSEIWRIPYLEHVYVWREQLKFCSVANKHSNLDVFGVFRRCHLKTHLWFQSDIPFASWKSRKKQEQSSLRFGSLETSSSLQASNLILFDGASSGSASPASVLHSTVFWKMQRIAWVFIGFFLLRIKDDKVNETCLKIFVKHVGGSCLESKTTHHQIQGCTPRCGHR